MAKKALNKGLFITFEGGEGSGKSTHARLLCEFLKKKGRRVILTREPGGTKIGEGVRDILLDKKNKNMSKNAEMLLYLASRAQIMDEVILPHLKKGCTVICDRFHDATVAYQGYALGLDIGVINQIGRFVTAGRMPDITILLDIPVKEGLKRAQARNRMEERPLSFHNKVRQGYLKLAKKYPRRIKVIKVQSSIKSTQEKIREIITNICLSNTY